MNKNKNFWYGQMVFAVVGWLFILSGLFVNYQNGIVHYIWWMVMILWCVGHPLELVASLPIGKKAGLSVGKTAVMTLIFGITWWIPLKMGVFEE